MENSMTKEDYSRKMQELLEEFSLKKDSLMVEYSKANNPYQVGDTFTDHMGSIRIESIRYGFLSLVGYPSCVYYGPELRKDGTPKKNGKSRRAWQDNDQFLKTI
jgi:hypothetical protein